MTTNDASTSFHPQEVARVRLSRFLALDAAVTGVNGLAYLVASGPLGKLLGVGSGLLLGLGVFLVVFAAAVAYTATRSTPAVIAVTAVIEANAVWAVLSVLTVVLWLDEPTRVGMVWIPLQALVVGGFAVLQFAALRRCRG